MNISDNPNQQVGGGGQQQQQQLPLTPQAQPQPQQTSGQTCLPQFQVNTNQFGSDFTHQTFQKWLETLVDPTANDDFKLKAITDLSLNLEVINFKLNHISLI